MKIVINLFILFLVVSIVAPMIYLFLSTFFNSDAVFYVAIIGALTVGYRGYKADQKIIQK
jgi:hypothetical protein